MENETTFEIELRIPTTGNIFCAEISNVTTVQEIIDALMTAHHLDPKLGLVWSLMHSGQILANDFVVSQLVKHGSPSTFVLIAKAQGG
jgi:hypothetical protein